MDLELNSAEPQIPDVHKLSICNGKDIWNYTAEQSDADNYEKKARVQSQIRALYDAGVPFFSKTAIQDVDRQLKNSIQTGEQIRISGLDGTVTQVEIETGRAYQIGTSDLEQVM